MQRPILLFVILGLGMCLAVTEGSTRASGADTSAVGTSDVDRARDALEQGAVLPLADIVRMVQDQVDARIIEVEFEEEDDHYVYEFELITPDGRLLEAKADPVTGRIIEMGEDADDD